MSKHKHKNLNDRRNFLRKLAGAGCASLSLTPLLSSITSLGMLNAAVKANQPAFISSGSSDYKALVCIMLAGGNDSFNMLIPYDVGSHSAYANARGGVHDAATNPAGIALERSDLKVLQPINTNLMGREFGLHPKMDKIQELFNGNPISGEKYVSFVANVGTLAQPLNNVSDLASYKKPNQLFSHNDQRMAWQTGVVQGELTTGWGGRTADILQSCNDYQDISMNISLDGLNLFQRGNNVTEYTIQSTGNGSIRLFDKFYEQELYQGNNFYHATKNASVDSILEQSYQNVLQKAYAKTVKQSLAKSDDFSNAISNFSISVNTDFTHPFPDTSIGNQLQMVAKSIATRNDLGGSGGINRQSFFVSMGTFDSHDNLIEEHDVLMNELDKALYAFYKALIEIGVNEGDNEGDNEFLEKVTGFTMSDFARTLSSNGEGSDHAWGGHHLVFGGKVNGGKIFGDYPDLANPNLGLDLGNGRFVPTTSCDVYFADLAMWFGASSSDLDIILPNIREFWTPSGTAGPLDLFV